MTATPLAQEPFDLLGPLPAGTAVLEASAGTGKTFALAGLVTRYVAEGAARMDELLVVSFSRESTRELRERVRERLVSARDGMLGAVAGHPVDPADRLLAFLAQAPPDELRTRLRRIEDALAAYDAATVTTTHGFCQQVLLTLGTACDHDPGAALVEDIKDLVGEVSDDLFVSRWGRPGAERPALKPAEFRKLALEVAGDPATTLLPDPELPGLDEAACRRARIAGVVRGEVDRRKRRRHLIDYDDLLLRLAATLTDPHSGPPARARLRERYRIVLVDEFQDTDPVQWAILREAFAGHATLVLIGDPKQAIYRFRGADVHAYLDAAATATTARTLPTSYRADEVLIRGLDAVFGGAALGDPRIRVGPVTAAHPGRLVVPPPGDGPAAVRLRLVPRDDLEQTKAGLVRAEDARTAVVADLAAEVVRLLATGTRVHPRDGGADRALEPGDIAVLVRYNYQARMVSDRLGAAGVPVVVSGRSSVFATPAAQEWLLLLEALEQPHRTTRVRRLALGCFVGLTATDLAERGDDEADRLALELREWGRVLADRGVAALFEAVSLAHHLQRRVLAAPGGERLLTDLRHVAQALHEAATGGQLGPAAVIAWLRRRREEAESDTGLARSRRLESDAAAVQVITVHTSKGLEFPVVLVPFAYDFNVRGDLTTAACHVAGERVRDVGGTGSPDWDAHVRAHQQEESDDELRLTYVALTRAQSLLLVWWVASTNTGNGPLHRLLAHRDSRSVAPQKVAVPSDNGARQAFSSLAASSDGALSVEFVEPRPVGSWVPPRRVSAAPVAASLDRELDTAWRRTSYSAMTAAAHEAALGSEAEVGQKDDEADVVVAASSDGAAPLSLWDALPSGTRFGTAVHAVLERVDDVVSVSDAVADVTARTGGAGDPALLTEALETSMATPLGGLADGATLRDVRTADRLAELDFELPLGGGDSPSAAWRVLTELVPLWRRHCPSGLLAGYADALAQLEPVPFRGYLTGSIDAVLRVGGPAAPRYLVVDYKTNRLGGADEPLTAWHYRPAALEATMVEAHYPLQALLYGVALHRYLRWRHPSYEPATHLGGSLYLFLRGMNGDSGSGVFTWRPPAALVTGTSDLLAGGA